MFMKDLQIVVVSWNVREYLERCLASLPAACEGMQWECVVVDNDSSDGSADMVKEKFAQDERIDVLTNHDNLGFARACNQGAVQHKARYVLLLNPDTECPAGSLKNLVAESDKRPDVGVMGPQITYEDGSYQESVRRFPCVVDQAMVSLKLHHIWPGAKVLDRYFHRDLEKQKSQAVDQVMGACFLVKAACWDKIHGHDSRYFIWFEEVDFCKQAKELGWQIWYEPSVKIVHHGGQAFAKTFSLRKQLMFNRSLRAYMYKWHGLLSWCLFALLQPLSICLASAASIGRRSANSYAAVRKLDKLALARIPCLNFLRTFFTWLLVFVAVESLSLAVNSQLLILSILTASAAAAMAWYAYRKPAAALVGAACELMIGGFGYLFRFDVPGLGHGVSLRMALMAGFFCGWGVNALQNRVWRYWKVKELILRSAWVFVGIMILAGIVRGLMNHQAFLLADLNAWLFLIYFIPVLDIANRHGVALKRMARPALIAAALWLPLKALFTFYVFTHFPDFSLTWYAWIRDTRVGEITPAGGQLVRIFLQSGIYTIFAVLFTLAWWVGRKQNEMRKTRLMPVWPVEWLAPGVWVLGMSSVVLSLSRSYWLGAAAGAITVLIIGIWTTGKIPWRALRNALLGTVVTVSVLFSAMWFPIPWPKAGNLGAWLADRGTISDAAASSRWNLLPAMWDKIRLDPVIGHGFGAAVTYQSRDPRVLKTNPDGWYTTYAFEWGWLDFWVKFGLFGIPIMLWLVGSVTWRLWKSPYAWWIRTGGVAATIALAVVHFFTPYLNHPLGFGWILGIECLLALSSPHPLFAIRKPDGIKEFADEKRWAAG